MRLAGALALVTLVLLPSAGATTIARVTLPQMEATATVVVVAEVKGVSTGNGLDEYALEPVRFMRGGPARNVTLSAPSLPGIVLGLERGGRYLVFAERRTFFGRWNRLTVSGYHQGVYRLLDDTRARNDSNGEVALDRLPAELRREARVGVTLVHEVDISKSAYIEGAAYVVRLERKGRVVAKATGYFDSPARFRVRQGWYVVSSGAHPCGGNGPCRSVDFQNDPGIDTCRKPVRLSGAKATIRVVAKPGANCRVELE
jgi:hypothetical protein